MGDFVFPISDERIKEFCLKHYIVKLSVFGSSIREDFGSDSDIDVLVEFAEGHIPGLDFFRMEKELSDILGRKVDLNTPMFISRYFRQETIKEAQLKYVET